jgi:esterase/lipase superfamily enzyme
MATALRSRGLQFGLDVWGDEVSHDWVWWRRQLVHHLPAVARGAPLQIRRTA